VHEAGVLERDAEAACERRQQADVALRERIRPVDVLERDAPVELVSERSGAFRIESGGSPTSTKADIGLPCSLSQADTVVDQHRFLGLDHDQVRRRVQRGGLVGKKRTPFSMMYG
jgi:hypothetical protein